MPARALTSSTNPQTIVAGASAASAFHTEGRTTWRSGIQTEDAAQPHLSRESRLLGQRALVLLCNSRKSTAPTGAVARVSRGASRPAIDTHRDSQTHHRRRSVRAYVVDDLRPCTSMHYRRPPGRSGNRSFVRSYLASTKKVQYAYKYNLGVYICI